MAVSLSLLLNLIAFINCVTASISSLAMTPSAFAIFASIEKRELRKSVDEQTVQGISVDELKKTLN
jgi:hypothetical protein